MPCRKRTAHRKQRYTATEPPVLQKASFRIVKGYLLHAERTLFRDQKNTYCNTLGISMLQQETDFTRTKG